MSIIAIVCPDVITYSKCTVKQTVPTPRINELVKFKIRTANAPLTEWPVD